MDRSGVDEGHPEFSKRTGKRNYLKRYSFYTPKNNNAAAPQLNYGTADESAVFGGGTQLGHGTHVAGILAAPNNGTGVVGVCQDCALIVGGKSNGSFSLRASQTRGASH